MTKQYRMTGLLAAILVAVGTADELTAAPAPVRHVRVLGVGNSFTLNATQYLRQFVAADPACKITLRVAYIGGCSLERHMKHVREYEKDPNAAAGRPYRVGKDKQSLRQLLTAEPWDVVTIQQVSYKSPDIKTYRPHAADLCAYIRKHAPGAEIVIHQTWAYRADYWLKGKRWGGQEGMYAGLTRSYLTVAGEQKIERIIPVGAAFQAVRRSERFTFACPDKDFDYASPPADRNPESGNALCLGLRWFPARKDRPKRFTFDVHANRRGCYLGGAVWFEFLFGRDVRQNTFAPKFLEPDEAAWLRQVAHETVTRGTAGLAATVLAKTEP